MLVAPIEKVWDAWTNPEVTNEFTVGGKYQIIIKGSNMPDPNYNGVMAVGWYYEA